MDVKFPIPVGEPTSFIKEDIRNRVFKREELESLLKEIESQLENACRELKTGKYSLVNYSLIAIDPSHKVRTGNLAIGGFMLYIEGILRTDTIDELFERYKKSLRSISREYRGDEINIYADLIAARDTITTIVEARDPH